MVTSWGSHGNMMGCKRSLLSGAAECMSAFHASELSVPLTVVPASARFTWHRNQVGSQRAA